MFVSARANKITAVFDKQGIDAFLVTNSANVRYLSGFKGIPPAILGYNNDDAALLLTRDENFLITDSRYAGQAENDTRNWNIRIRSSSITEEIMFLSRDMKIKRLGFEPDCLSYGGHEKLRRILNDTALIAVSGLVETGRQIKDKDEIDLIKNSIRLLRESVDYFGSIVTHGITEKSLAAKIESFVLEKTGERGSFETIVASGLNSAYPHARPTQRLIQADDMVMLDIGVNYGGYNSDLTRVFFLGKIKPRAAQIYNLVKDAQRNAIKAIRPGVEIASIDRAARSLIEKKGFGGNFGHALGHGIGLEVHERPVISGRNCALLEPGMIFTVEPAVYLPGWGGVRIEDMVLVTRKGCEVLTDDINK